MANSEVDRSISNTATEVLRVLEDWTTATPNGRVKIYSGHSYELRQRINRLLQVVESVIATIEIKSWFRKPELLNAEKSAKKLREEICNPEIIAGFKDKRLLPLCAVIGFYGNGVKGLSHKSGKEWLNENIEHLFAICLVKKYSWMRVVEPSWRLINYEKETNEETKRFIAVLIDNIRTLSINRFIPLMGGMHQDWLSAYIRK